ncbi:hypothetical protein NXX27_22290 [Bacteroides fragilis]|nr:hypothetical protein [Bacteroides fragilis]
MADANNYDWTRYTYFIPKSFSQYDGYCSYEPMQDPIDAYWDVDGKTMRNDITMEQRKRTLCGNMERFQRYEPISIHRKSVPQIDIMKI